MLTAADRIDDKASGFGLGADDYLTKPFELRELVMRLRALDRRRAHSRPPVREIAGLRLDPFRREVFRDGRYVALTRKRFAVLEVLMADRRPGTGPGGLIGQVPRRRRIRCPPGRPSRRGARRRSPGWFRPPGPVVRTPT